MNKVIKEVEKNIRKAASIGKSIKAIENELFKFALEWPIKTY
jgi:hypothetical protein